MNFKNDITGKKCKIIWQRPRNEVEPLPGVKLLGDVVRVEDEDGTVHDLYNWELSTINDT